MIRGEDKGSAVTSSQELRAYFHFLDAMPLWLELSGLIDDIFVEVGTKFQRNLARAVDVGCGTAVGAQVLCNGQLVARMPIVFRSEGRQPTIHPALFQSQNDDQLVRLWMRQGTILGCVAHQVLHEGVEGMAPDHTPWNSNQ